MRISKQLNIYWKGVFKINKNIQNKKNFAILFRKTVRSNLQEFMTHNRSYSI